MLKKNKEIHPLYYIVNIVSTLALSVLIGLLYVQQYNTPEVVESGLYELKMDNAIYDKYSTIQVPDPTGTYVVDILGIRTVIYKTE